MGDADELSMLRSSVRQAAGDAAHDAAAAPATWARVRAIGWEHAFVSSGDATGAVGATEVVAVAEECGRQAVALPVPALVVGLLAAVRQRRAGGEAYQDATADDAVVLWATGLPPAYWRSSSLAVRTDADVGVDLAVPGFELATHVLALIDDGGERLLLWRASDLSAAAVPIESLDAAVPARRLHVDDAIACSAVAHDQSSRAELDLCRDVAMLVAAAQAVGLLERALTASVAYACDRTAFGRPIGAFQAVKHMLADVKMALECSRAMVGDAAQRVDDRDPSAQLAVAGTARFVGRHVLDGLQLCVQVHGGIGITMESELHQLLRRATTLRFLFLEPNASGRRILDLRAREEKSRV